LRLVDGASVDGAGAGRGARSTLCIAGTRTAFLLCGIARVASNVLVVQRSVCMLCRCEAGVCRSWAEETSGRRVEKVRALQWMWKHCCCCQSCWSRRSACSWGPPGSCSRLWSWRLCMEQVRPNNTMFTTAELLWQACEWAVDGSGRSALLQQRAKLCEARGACVASTFAEQMTATRRGSGKTRKCG
jgi:hypothetical protein